MSQVLAVALAKLLDGGDTVAASTFTTAQRRALEELARKTGYDALPADVRKLAEERRDALKADKLHPFTGPLKDQSGKELLAAGKSYTDADLLKINYYVEGVEGSIPK